MKVIKLAFLAIIYFSYSHAQSVKGNDMCSRWAAGVADAFSSYKNNEDNKKSAFFLTAAKQADSILGQCSLNENARKEFIFKKAILELYGLIILDSYEYRLVENPASKQKVFEERIKFLKSLPVNTETARYKNHVLGSFCTYVKRSYAEAESHYQKVYSSDSNWDILLKDRAWNFMQWAMKNDGINPDSANKYFDLAEKTAKSCLSVSPKLSYPYIILGYASAFKRDIKKAMEQFDTAEQLNPENRSVNLAKGYCYGNTGNWDSALLYDRKAIKGSSNFLTAYTNMAQHYVSRYQLKDIDSAYSLYRQCIAFNPYEPYYYKCLGSLFSYSVSKTDDPKWSDSAAYYYSKAAHLDPSYIEELGDYYYDIFGMFDMAKIDLSIMTYKQMLKLKNDVAHLYYKIGRNYYMKASKSDDDSAISYFHKAIQLDSNDAWAHLLLGETAYKYNKELAKRHLDKFLSLPLPTDRNIPLIVDKLTRFADSLMNKGGDRFAAYKYYMTAARLGNEAAKFAALGLKYEMGYDGVLKDTSQAMFWYQQAAQRFPVMRMAWKRLVSLSETGKWPMTNDSLWKQLASLGSAALKQQDVFIVGDNRKKMAFRINIIANYPKGIHPLEWEGQRLINDHPSYAIKNENVNDWGMIMAYSKEKAMSEMNFIETFHYLNNYDQITNYDSIIQEAYKKFDFAYRKFGSAKQGDKIKYLETVDSSLKKMLAIDSTPVQKKFVSHQYQRLARDYISIKDDHSYQQAIHAAKSALILRPTNVDAASYLFAALWCAGETDKAKDAYIQYRPSVVDERDGYNDVFLNNLGYFLKEERDSAKKQYMRGLLFPAISWINSSRSLKDQNFAHLLTSNDTAEIYRAVIYSLRSDHKDTLLLAKKLIERLRLLSNDSLYINKYLDCLLLLSISDAQFSPPSLDTVDQLFDRSELPAMDYPFIKYYLKFIDKGAFQDLVNIQLDNWKGEDDANNFSFWLEKAEKLKRDVRYGVGSSNTSRVLAARKAVDWFEIFQKKFQQDSAWQRTIAKDCGGFSYTIITLRDFETALQAALIAEAADSTEAYYKTNLPLAYLLNGNFAKAKELYLQWKDMLFTGDGITRTYGQVFLDDFKDLEQNYSFDPRAFDNVKRLLTQ